MSSEDKKQIFAKANQSRENEKKEEAKKGSYTQREYENIAYLPLETNKGVVFRILGNPINFRKDPSDPKPVNIAMIQDDNKKKFRCVFPDHSENKDWILWRIYDLILDGKWEGSGDHRTKVYKYEDIHPECFNRVRWNNNQSKYERGWTPRAYVIMNVIDRSDMKWHKENKHSKILSSKASEYSGDNGKSTVFYEPGIPRNCYNKIWDDVVEYGGPWEDYDICVKKLEADPWYKAFHCIDDVRKLDADAKSLVYDGDLTKEEENWERYDLDKFFAVTSYNKIKAKLENFIKKVDVDFGTSFFPELEKLAEEEKAKWEEEHKEEEVNKSSTETYEVGEKEDPIGPPPLDEEEEVDTPPRRSSRESSSEEIPWDKLADGSFNGTEYLGVPLMTDEEKELVIGVNSDGSFEYKKEAGTLYKDTKSGFKSPGAFHVDPLSGGLF